MIYPFREGRRGTQLFPTLLETHRLLDCIAIMLGTVTAHCRVIAKGVEKLIEQAQRFARYAHFTDFTDSSGRGCLKKALIMEFNETLKLPFQRDWQRRS